MGRSNDACLEHYDVRDRRNGLYCFLRIWNTFGKSVKRIQSFRLKIRRNGNGDIPLHRISMYELFVAYFLKFWLALVSLTAKPFRTDSFGALVKNRSAYLTELSSIWAVKTWNFWLAQAQKNAQAQENARMRRKTRASHII